MKKILIASAWLNESRSYDLAVWKKRRNMFAVNAPMTEHFGLRFLKANHPEIEILEYPTREIYTKALQQKWDAVGISFYINETNDAVEMARLAREAGVPEVWSGNFGAMTPEMADVFDRSHNGWGELMLAKELNKEPAALVHPEIYMHVSWRQMHMQSWGVLFTSRGCNETCTFCQTPRFYKKPYTLDMTAIENVLQIYKSKKVNQIIVLDENFGHFKAVADEVIDRLKFYGMRWNPMTRVGTLYENYEKWKKSGLSGASIGLESLNQASLDGAKKGNDLEKGLELLRWMNRDGLLIQTFYIIGFEQDTVESIRENIYDLRQYHIDSPQIQILTPQPGTNMYKYIDKTYGITTTDYSKYDTTNLVWNHPNIEPQQLRDLMLWANDVLFTRSNSFRTMRKVGLQSIRNAISDRRISFTAPLWSGNIDTLGVPIKELVKFGGRGSYDRA